MLVTRVEELFLRTLDDLETRVASQDPYEVLGVSALIRKLFLDRFPLVDQVNRQYQKKIQFEIAGPLGLPPGLPPPTYWSVQDGIDPDTALPTKTRTAVSRDQFFGTVLSIVNGRQFTVREIILFEANVMGGIHAGTAKGEKEKVLDVIGQEIAVGGYRSSLRQLKGIGRVILKALTPIADEIRTSKNV